MAPLYRLLGALLVAFLVTVAAGCGKKGALIPPEALVPAPVNDLAVAQKGGHFQVSWSAPGKQEGGLPLKDLAGFLLLRRPVLPPDQDCEECPTAYQELARIYIDYLQGARQVGGLLLYDDAELAAGNTYQYKVDSFTNDGAVSKDSNKVRRTAIVPPAAPVLEALSAPTGVVLAFVAPPPRQGTLVGYNVYRAKKGEEMPLAPMNPAPLTGSTYEDKLLLVGFPYDYQVTSVAAFGGETAESAPSNTAQGQMLPRD